jgi:hypothetical protein
MFSAENAQLKALIYDLHFSLIKYKMKKYILPLDWVELQNKLKAKFPNLTETDLTIQEGNEQDMLRMVEYKLRKTKKELNNIINKF